MLPPVAHLSAKYDYVCAGQAFCLFAAEAAACRAGQHPRSWHDTDSSALRPLLSLSLSLSLVLIRFFILSHSMHLMYLCQALPTSGQAPESCEQSFKCWRLSAESKKGSITHLLLFIFILQALPAALPDLAAKTRQVIESLCCENHFGGAPVRGKLQEERVAAAVLVLQTPPQMQKGKRTKRYQHPRSRRAASIALM